MVEIGPVVLEKKIIKFCQYIFSGPSVEQTWLPFTHVCFVPSLAEIGQVLLEKKMEMWKVYDNEDDHYGQRTYYDRFIQPTPTFWKLGSEGK